MSKLAFTKLLNELAHIFKDPESIEAIDYLLDKVGELPMESNPSERPSAKSKKKTISKNKKSFAIPKEILDMPLGFAIYSDGACRGNPGVGAWGVLAQNSAGQVLFESAGVKQLTTNNQMELEGAIQGLLAIQEHLTRGGENNLFLFSDSKYVVDGIQNWVPGWKARDWKKADKKAPENLSQWQRLDELVGQFKNLTFKWVKGHAGHAQNERADELANRALDAAGF